MFKITCSVKKQEKSFYLAKVSLKEVEQVANVLANNLSFDSKNTKPIVLSISKIKIVGTPFFEYFGVETVSFEPENEFKHIKDLNQQGFLVGAIYNINEKSTSLYKFKVIKE